MAAINAPFHGLSTKLYVKTTAHTNSALAAGDLLGEVQEVGTLELTANIIEYNAYNNNFKRKLVGQRDSGVLSIKLNWVPDAGTEAVQDLVRQHYESGVVLYFALLWTDAAGDQAIANFTGFVSSFSISQPVEDVVTADVQIAIDGSVTFDTDGTL